MKYIWTLICLLIFVGLSFYLYRTALMQSTYEGLPTVPCIDYTQPVLQNYSLTISLQIDNKPYPLDSTIGHDYGNCLHDIFVNDSSGKVYVKANDSQQFTLGQFFDVWKKTFNQGQIFSYQVGDNHTLEVFVDDKKVTTFRATLLKPNQHITIIYQ